MGQELNIRQVLDPGSQDTSRQLLADDLATGLVPSSITDARALHHRHSRSKLLPLNPRELNGSRARRGVRASDAAEVRLSRALGW